MAGCFDGLVIDAPVYVAITTAIGVAVLAIWMARNDHFPGRGQFLAALGGMTWWLATAALEMSTPALGCKVVFATLAWPAIPLVPVSWCFFMLHFCFGLRFRWPRAEAAITASIVAAVAAAAFSNPWHGLFYVETTLVMIAGRASAVYAHGPLFYAAASLLYIFLLASLVIAVAGAFAASRSMRPLMLFLMAGTAAPVAANVAYVWLGMTLAGFDPTPFAFALVLGLFTSSIYTNRAFDLKTVARDVLYFNVDHPVVVVNGVGMVAGANPAALALMPGITPGKPLDGAGPLAIVSHALADAKGGERRQNLEIGDRMLDLRVVPIPRPLDEGGAPLGAVAIMTDVTALQQNARRLESALAQLQAQVVEITLLREIAERSALLDPLTGLGNRRSLSQAFEALGNAPVAVALIDIDHFKQINDRLGHGVGDRVLRAFSDAVRSVLPEGCSVYRVGGEEFFALCPGITQSSMLAILGRLAQRVVDDPPLREHDHPRVTFSGGVAVRPGDGETFDQLYARADARLYEAKRGGRNRVMHLDGMPFDTPVSPGGPGGKGRASHG